MTFEQCEIVNGNLVSGNFQNSFAAICLFGLRLLYGTLCFCLIINDVTQSDLTRNIGNGSIVM